jgi:hypothetical protein
MIKTILPDAEPRQQIIKQKRVLQLIDAATRTYELSAKDAKVSPDELLFVRSRVGKRLKEMHVIKVKTAVLEGLTQKPMQARFRDEKGLKNMSHIKNIRAALSEFNGWDLKTWTKK